MAWHLQKIKAGIGPVYILRAASVKELDVSSGSFYFAKNIKKFSKRFKKTCRMRIYRIRKEVKKMLIEYEIKRFLKGKKLDMVNIVTE